MPDPTVIKGALIPSRPGMTSDDFDRAHGVTAQGELMKTFTREAYGDEYPEDVDPWGMTTQWTLATFLDNLNIRDTSTLVDVACGRGGVGLWLAKHSGCHLIGVDFSPVAVEEATGRVPDWVPDDHARFQVGDLLDTGLPSGSADAVVCADGVSFAIDRVAAIREVARLLKSGGRYVFTADESDDDRPAAVPDWSPIIEAGGLHVISRIEIPMWREQLGRMYEISLERLDEARELLGEESAKDLQDEAEAVGPSLATRTGVLYVAEL